jgi:hypothetical protein
MQRHELEPLNREELISLAERLSVPRPRVLTQPELIDEILTRTARSERDLERSRGWFGRARDLLASVVERGLHLPEVARVLRATPASRSMPTPPPPLATVTLAEIYAAQGHLDRALTVLDEVLSREPAHEAALKLRDRFFQQTGRARVAATEPDVQPVLEPTEPPVPPAAAVMEEEEPQPQAHAEPQPHTSIEQGAVSETVVEAAGGGAEPPGLVVTEDRSSEAASQAGVPSEALAELAAEAPAELAAEAPAELAAEAPAEVAAEGAPGAVPARYHVDEVVAIAVDPTTLYFYWEVRPTTLARLRAAKPTGALIARIVSVVASWQGPQMDQRDVRIDLLYGDHTERGIPSGSHVRVSIGWVSGADFDPIAIGTEVEVPRALPAESVALHVGQWTHEPAGLPLRPAGDRGQYPAMYAAAHGPIGHLSRAGLGAPLRTGVLSSERLAPGTAVRPGGSTGPSLGGASELGRGERIGAG